MFDSLKDVLFDGENVLWQGKPDKFCFIWRSFGKLLPVAVIWILFDGFFIGTMVSTGAAKDMWPFMIIFFGIHLLPVWKLIGSFVKACVEYKNVV